MRSTALISCECVLSACVCMRRHAGEALQLAAEPRDERCSGSVQRGSGVQRRLCERQRLRRE
jgi:hypothetical protein